MKIKTVGDGERFFLASLPLCLGGESVGEWVGELDSRMNYQ